MTNGVTDSEAKEALDAIERSRRQVIDEIDMPRWYWWGLALGWIGLGVVADLKRPWLSIAATLAFGAVHAAVSHLVIGGRHRTTQLSVRRRGRPTCRCSWSAVSVGLVGLTIICAIAASVDDARHPVTMASLFVAVVILLGGPRLMAAIRRRAARSSTLP
jgi:hypothetical protein